MSLVQIFSESGLPGLLMLLVVLLASVGSLAVGIALVVRQRVPPVVIHGVLALVPLVAIGATLWSRSSALDWMATASPEMKQTLIARAVSVGMSTHILAGAVVLPVSILLVLSAVAGALRGPRRVALPVVAGVAAVLLALTPALGALLTGLSQGAGIDPLMEVLRWGPRSVAYLLAGALTAVALLGGDHETSGPTAGATAALALPVLVGALELSSVAWEHAEVFHAVAYASPESKQDLLLTGLEWAAARRPAGWLALGIATVVALVGAVGALAPERPGHASGVLGGLAALVPVAVAWSRDTTVVLLLLVSTQLG